MFAAACVAALLGLQEPPIPLERAAAYVGEVKALLERDRGALWGKPLDGPFLFVDPRTRAVVASRADAEGKLQEKGGLFVGSLPASVNAANTATSWAGVRWTMVMWTSIAPEPRERARLLIHELFHRAQDELGFPASNPSNPQLDELEGRVGLRLEWRALRSALAADGDARRAALRDAVNFRLRRQTRFPGSAETEALLERNEGLAEYTGLKLCGRSDAELRALLSKRMAGAEAQPSFVRSFAYESGPAYGLLLDALDVPWRAGLDRKFDFGALARGAVGGKPSPNFEERYDGATVRAEEESRERDRQARLAGFQKKFVDGPVLVLRGDKLDFSYDPSTLQPFGARGTVYPTLRVSEAWGVLEASDGALMSADFKTVTVSAPGLAPSQGKIAGPGWTLDLASGWRIEKDAREGDFVAVRRP